MQHKFTLPLLFVHYNEPYGVSLWLNLVFIIFIIFLLLSGVWGFAPWWNFKNSQILIHRRTSGLQVSQRNNLFASLNSVYNYI
jgi:hypothetical protein